LNTEINDRTVDVLIESAYFKPQNIRATSKKLELRTESSYRFERGGDIGICDWASQRAAQLILETAGGTLAQGLVDACRAPAKPKQITLRPHKVTELLGIDLTPVEVESYLGALEVLPVNRKPQPVGAGNQPAAPVAFSIPTFRVDLKREIDLIEEIARLYGVDKIPATPPRGAIGSNAFDAIHDQFADARRLLTGLGLYEAQGQTLISDTAARLATTESLAALANPLSSDMNVLRPSLLPGLLDSLRHNLSRKVQDLPLFELGRVFSREANGQFREERRIAIAITGQRQSLFWSGDDREAKFDIYDLKGLLDEFLESFGLRGISFTRRADSTSLLLESATIQLGKLPIGQVGQLLPPLAKQYDLRDAVFLAELNLGELIARRNPARNFKALPAFPSMRRDVAMVVPEEVTHESVVQVVKQAKPANLESVDLFDVFRGKNIPAGQKSMAYAFTYRSTERTLTDTETNAAHEKVLSQLKDKLKAVVRDQ
jgi:phenylalanyl-tRNA synthetase beta chain